MSADPAKPRRPLLGPVLIGLVIAAAASAAYWFAGSNSRELAARVAIGAQLYGESCAACHGVNLEGQPDWKQPLADGTLPPPPHDETGHTWHHGDKLLFDYIKLGGAATLAQSGILDYDSGMPAFGGAMSDAEITAVLDFIKSRWSDEIRANQRIRTKAEETALE